MGLFQQQLIRFLACLVAIDLAVGVVAIQQRRDRVSTVSAGARTSQAPSPSAGSPVDVASARSDGILAGGSFSRRRISTRQSTSEPAAGQSAATAPALPSTASSPSTRTPTVPTGGSTPSRPRPAAPAAGPATTTSTSRAGRDAVAPSPPTAAAGQPTTAAEGTSPPSDAARPNASTPSSSAPQKTTAPSSTTSGVWTVMTDATGDTVVDGSGAPQANARADMVQSRATNTTKAIGFAVKVAEPVDPTRDPHWASATTFVLWEIDTSGDDKPEFEVEYFLEAGKLFAGVSRVTGNGRQAACEAEAGYMSESYIVGIDPACLGSPASLSYRASVYYGVDPNNSNADSITDVTPDGGMSTPLRRTAV